MRHLPHVALLVETSRSYGRGILRGIRRYLSEHGPWSVYLEVRAMDSRGPPWLRHWRGDGILTRTGSWCLADLLRAAGVPTVETRTTRFLPDVPFVGVDNHALGRGCLAHSGGTPGVFDGRATRRFHEILGCQTWERSYLAPG